MQWPTACICPSSKLMSARQCLKRLYLEVHRPELIVHSSQTEAAFNTGIRWSAGYRPFGPPSRLLKIARRKSLDAGGMQPLSIRKTALIARRANWAAIYPVALKQHFSMMVCWYAWIALLPDTLVMSWRHGRGQSIDLASRTKHVFDCKRQQQLGVRGARTSNAQEFAFFAHRSDNTFAPAKVMVTSDALAASSLR